MLSVTTKLKGFNDWWMGVRKSPDAGRLDRYQSLLSPPIGGQAGLLELTTSTAVVATALDLVAEACAGVGFNVEYRPKAGKKRPLEGHEFVEVLDWPNDVHSGFELMEKTFHWQEAVGNAYWFYEPTPEGKIKEIWPLRPDRVSIIPDKNQLIWGYRYTVQGIHLDIPKQFVTHFKLSHPLDDWFGLGRIQAALLDIASEKSMAEYSNQFFGRKVAKLDGILVVPSSLTDDEYDAVSEAVEYKYGDTRSTMVIRAAYEGETTQFLQTGVTQKDMEFIEGRKFIRQIVLERLGIPTGMMSEASTEAHARVAERRFLERIYKRHMRNASVITRDALPLYGRNLVGYYDDVRIADAEQKKAKIEAMASVASVDEQREELGLVPVGDDSIAVQQFGQMVAGAAEEETPKEDDTRGARAELAQLRRWYRPGRDLSTFGFRVLGSETRKELLAVWKLNPQTFDPLFMYVRGNNELVR